MQYLFGVDIGGTTVKIGLVSHDGVIIDKFEIKTNIENNGDIVRILKQAAQTDDVGIGAGDGSEQIFCIFQNPQSVVKIVTALSCGQFFYDRSNDRTDVAGASKCYLRYSGQVFHYLSLIMSSG